MWTDNIWCFFKVKTPSSNDLKFLRSSVGGESFIKNQEQGDSMNVFRELPIPEVSYPIVIRAA